MTQSKLLKQLEVLNTYIDRDDFTNLAVSKASSYWQVAHSLRVLHDVTNLLLVANPIDYEPKWSFLKLVIMTTGIIPRGKVRAPKQTAPVVTYPKEDLKRLYNDTKAALNKLNTIPEVACFKHPFFGWMRKNETVKFMAIHTKHHLKILRDMSR